MNINDKTAVVKLAMVLGLGFLITLQIYNLHL